MILSGDTERGSITYYDSEIKDLGIVMSIDSTPCQHYKI